MTAYDDDDLRILKVRIGRVLTRMSVLSSGSTSRSFGTDNIRVSNGQSAGSRIPNGARLDEEPRGGPPDKERSLYDHFRYRFQQAMAAFEQAKSGTSYDQLARLVDLAESAYREHAIGNRTPHNEETVAAEKRVLEDWRGWPAATVAVHERCSVEWVRKTRRLTELRPTDGLPDDDLSARDREILAALRAGDTIRTIADRMGVGVATVHRTQAGA